MKCPVCESDSEDFLQVDRTPVFCNQLCSTEEEALSAPTASMKLAFCEQCSHIFNFAFDASQLEYNPAYENSLHFSSRFQQYADQLADELIERYDLQGKTVVEIGCGAGDFLKSLCARASCKGLGFDPSYSGPLNPTNAVTIQSVALDTEVLEGVAPDLVTCRHVLEHVSTPTAFLKSIRESIGDAPVFFEVPNGLYTLQEEGIWDLIYEHCGYFVPSSLERAFAEAGYAVEQIRPTFDGQFLIIYARPGEPVGLSVSREGLKESAALFASVYRNKIDGFAKRLEEAATAGKRVAAWGAGSKGTIFLNVMPPQAVSYIVDINPRKQGKFVAGTGHQIVGLDRVKEAPPDMVVIMNSIYDAEITNSLSEMGLHPEIFFA